MNSVATKKPFKKEPRKPRKISRQYLENAALYYLQRYASSAKNLRRVLMRKVERSCAFHGTDPAEFPPIIDDMIARYLSSGLLNDKNFAEAQVSSLRRQGKSRQAITAKLSVKGLSKDDIETALLRHAEENEDGNSDLSAARILARRKKLGPYRAKPLTDPKEKQKEMAALARAGYSYDICRRVLDFDDSDE